jgi:hypothetical protein
MLQRLREAGLNLMVLLVSLAVFLASFGALSYFAESARPQQLTVLAASRDLAMGEAIGPNDLMERRVYRDENAGLYILAGEMGSVVGGVAALPVGVGQPLFRSAVLAPAGQGTRLAAFLADHPGHSLFPLPLSAQNVVAPEAHSFLPGDLVGITVVIGSRPQAPATPGAPFAFSFPSLTPEPSPEAESRLAEPSPESEQGMDRAHPPLAKDLFPQGLRVIAVQGLPAGAATDTSGSSGFASVAAAPAVFDLARERTLILLVPDEGREALALALEQGHRLFVSLLAGGGPGAAPGFTYWDFEERFRQDREQISRGTGAP